MQHFVELAHLLAAEGRIPVLVGLAPLEGIAGQVCESCPTAVDLTGRTSVGDLIFLTWAAAAALGPDNGIMHVTAVAGCPSVVLYDLASDPALVGQRGDAVTIDAVTILRRNQLADVPVGEAMAALQRSRRERARP